MKRSYWISGIVLLLVVLGAGAGYSLYFAKTVNPPHARAGAATACGTTVPTTGLRTFQIVPDQTTAAYKVHENLILHNLPSTDAIGTTHSVQGTFQFVAGASPVVASLKITVDVSTLQTNEPKRDRFVRDNSLDTATYPTATFVSTCAENLPANYVEGQPAHFQITGNLTLHGTTNKEVADVQATLAGNTITGTATMTVFMTDFNIEPPNLANVAIAENKAIITITFTAKEGL